MLTTLMYITGALSLHFTDLQSDSLFFSLLLPTINLVFFIFIVWQLIFFFSLGSFAHDDDYSFFHLVDQLWHIGGNIKDYGAAHTLMNVSILLINSACLIAGVIYYFGLFLDFV